MDLSVIIINKNYKKYIENCISSCQGQKTKYLYEIIVIDDGSTDGSLKLIEKFKNQNIRIFKTKNKGIEKASNLGLKKSTGKFIMRVDSDDYLRNNCIEILMNSMNKKKYSFVYSDYFLINEKKKIRRIHLPKFNQKEIFERGDFLATGTIYRKKIVQKIGYYNENKKNSGLENYELVLKLLLKKNGGKHINKSLFYYRKHKKNISTKIKDKIEKNGDELFRELKLGKYQTNKYNPHRQ